MDNSFASLNTLIALLLPWLLGSVWCLWLLGRGGRWNMPIVIGHGYLLGLFTTTLIMRLWNAAGMPLGFAGPATTVACLTLIGAGLLKVWPIKARAPATCSLPRSWEWAAVAILASLMVLRYYHITLEVLLRPLFPWDAWMNWAPKAIVWEHYSALVPFASASEWLQARPEDLVHMEGALNAWKYPITVPLIQLWGMLAVGSSDHTYPYLPWVLLPLAMGSALYGHLRLSGYSLAVSVVALYLLLNMPFVNVHAALAGYADLWVAGAFGCAVFAVSAWYDTGNKAYVALAIMLGIMATQLKIPGLVMAGIVLLTLGVTWLRIKTRLALPALAVLLLFIISLVAIGVELNVPGSGRVVISMEEITLPYLGSYTIDFHPVQGAMVDTIFLMINWNILGYIMIPAMLLMLSYRKLDQCLPQALALAASLSFIFLVYFFTERSEFATDYTQVNRALLYSIPVAIYFLITLLPGGRFGATLDQGNQPPSTNDMPPADSSAES
jgi:hypothetical protein